MTTTRQWLLYKLNDEMTPDEVQQVAITLLRYVSDNVLDGLYGECMSEEGGEEA